MSFWSLSLGQESVSSLFSTLATPIQGIAAIPAAALGTVGHSLTSAQTFAPNPIPQTSKINDVATATPHTAFYDFSSPGGNLLSMYNTLVMNSAANVAALVAPVSEYVPAPLAALAAYAPANPFAMATTPPRETECLDKTIANNSASAASIMGSAPPTQTASSFALLSRNAISPQVLTPNSPAMTLFMALATNPQVQGLVATAIAGLVSSSLPTILRNAPPSSGGALLQSVLSAAPPPPLPAVPSPTLNNRLNFGPNTLSAALMSVVAARYAREFGGNKPIPTTSGTNPSKSAPAATVPAVALNANPSGMRTLPSTIIDLFGTVAIPMMVNAISSTVKAAKRTPNVAKASSASVPSPTPDAALAVVSPIRQELQRVAIFAGRNAALAVLYYVLIKYFGPAGLSVKVAFTLATLLMDVLI